MDSRLRGLAEQLDAHEVSRREFLRRSVLITGGTAAGLHVLSRMAQAQRTARAGPSNVANHPSPVL